MTLTERFEKARKLASLFSLTLSTALEFERGLVELGFYNVEFSPPAATFDGVRYPLTTHFTELMNV